MYKGCIFIGNILNNVSVGLGYNHVDFRYFQALIIVNVAPAIPETYGPFSVACVQVVYTVWEAGKPKRCARCHGNHIWSSEEN